MKPGRALERRISAGWRSITDLERRAIVAISPNRIAYPDATFYKKFAREIQFMLLSDGPRSGQITDKQAQLLWDVLWQFREQVSDVELVQEAERHQATRPRR